MVDDRYIVWIQDEPKGMPRHNNVHCTIGGCGRRCCLCEVVGRRQVVREMCGGVDFLFIPP